METTEARYNFYKRAFKGGALEQTQPDQYNQAQPQPDQAQQVQYNQDQGQVQGVQQMEGQEGQEQINQQVPKTKVDFKISSMIGNLDQTLGSKQKINIDSMFVKQLFGIN